MTLKFRRLPGRPAAWSEMIANYPMKTLFHEPAWLDHVQDIEPRGELVYYELLRDGVRVGLHCGLKVRRMLIPIHGSPLRGTGTNFMGPLYDADIDPRAVVDALFALRGPRTFLHLELSNPALPSEVMTAAGFAAEVDVTHLVPLPRDLDAAWGALRSEARNRVRKAERNGLIVEATEDPSVVDHFYEQFGEVYAKQGMIRPWGVERPRSLFNRLLPAGRVLPIWVRYNGEVLAAGLFPFDERCIYFWGAASWLRHQALCPNEALQWGVIKFAVEHGIPAYNMCGGTSQFKNKFGGEDVPHVTYHKSAVPLLRTARNWYRDRHFRSLRVAGPSAE
jgi:hypothetical protein